MEATTFNCPAPRAFHRMARFDEPIEPMTLGNMRANGVRSPEVTCWQYHQRAQWR